MSRASPELVAVTREIGSSFVPRCLCGRFCLRIARVLAARVRPTHRTIELRSGSRSGRRLPRRDDAARNLRRTRACRRGRARQPAGRARSARDHRADVRAGESGASPRGRFRSVRSDALSGRSRRDAGDRTRGAGDGRADSDARRCDRRSGVIYYTRVVRRPHRRCRPRCGRAPRIRRFCRRSATTRAAARRRGPRISTEPICCARFTRPASRGTGSERIDRVAKWLRSGRDAQTATACGRITSPVRTCASPSVGRSGGNTSRARRSNCGGLATSYRFSGHGSGHGVGLCVIGSAHLAEQGRTAEEILARYFPGLTISGARHVPGTGPTAADRGRSAGEARAPVQRARQARSDR